MVAQGGKAGRTSRAVPTWRVLLLRQGCQQRHREGREMVSQGGGAGSRRCAVQARRVRLLGVGRPEKWVGGTEMVSEGGRAGKRRRTKYALRRRGGNTAGSIGRNYSQRLKQFEAEE